MPLPYVDPNKPVMMTRLQFKSSLGVEKGQRARILGHDAAQRAEIEKWKQKYFDTVRSTKCFLRRIDAGTANLYLFLNDLIDKDDIPDER